MGEEMPRPVGVLKSSVKVLLSELVALGVILGAEVEVLGNSPSTWVMFRDWRVVVLRLGHRVSLTTSAPAQHMLAGSRTSLQVFTSEQNLGTMFIANLDPHTETMALSSRSIQSTKHLCAFMHFQ